MFVRYWELFDYSQISNINHLVGRSTERYCAVRSDKEDFCSCWKLHSISDIPEIDDLDDNYKSFETSETMIFR